MSTEFFPRAVRRGWALRVCQGLALVAGLLAGLGSIYAAETSSPGTGEASAYFNAGNEAFARGDTHEAYRQYLLAWQLNRAFDIACNLGRAEAELGKLVDALQHLDFCLDNFSASPQPELKSARQRYAELRQTARAQVAAIQFHIQPEGAEITLDGASLGSPPEGKDIYLRPGEHVIEVRQKGHRPIQRRIVAQAGETRVFELALEPETSASTDEPEAASTLVLQKPQPRSHFDQRRTLTLAGAALTLVSAGVGIGFYLQGRKLDDEAASIRHAIADEGGEPCADRGGVDCDKLVDTIDRRDSAVRYSSAGFVAMGALGLGTLALWRFWPAQRGEGGGQLGSSPLRVGQTDIVPWMGQKGAGVMLTGSL